MLCFSHIEIRVLKHFKHATNFIYILIYGKVRSHFYVNLFQTSSRVLNGLLDVTITADYDIGDKFIYIWDVFLPRLVHYL